MIGKQEQDELFELVSSKIEGDIVCYAFGGTALMYYGYKESTKDIDILFEREDDMKVFIKAINELGFKKRALAGVYDQDRIENKDKPLMFERGDARFDLFVKNIFSTEFTEEMKDRSRERHDFTRKDYTLTVMVISIEDLVILKSVTNRENDYADIQMLLKKSEVDWSIIVDEAIRQKDRWTILDLEETMQRLKKDFYIPKKYFDKLHKSI